jgi:hypothetical protein
VSSVGDGGAACGAGVCEVDGFDGFDAPTFVGAFEVVAGDFASSSFGGCVWITGGRGVTGAGCDVAFDVGALCGATGCAGFGCDGICNGSCALELGCSGFGSAAFDVTTTAGGVKRGGIGSGRLGMKTGCVAAGSLGFGAGGADGFSGCVAAG